MSLLKDRHSQQVATPRRQVRHTVLQKPKVGTKPAIRVRTRYIEKQPVVKPSIWPAMALRAGVFGFVAGATFFLSSLSGHVMVEKGRKSLSEMRERTVAARKSEAMIRERVNLLTRSDKLEQWALANGMTPIDSLGAVHGTGGH